VFFGETFTGVNEFVVVVFVFLFGVTEGGEVER